MKARNEFNGTYKNDQIKGFSSSDIINGLSGADSLQGERGNDTIYGGNGNDVMAGERFYEQHIGDNDILYGGKGNDAIEGNGGDDLLLGETGNDFLFGDDGNDTLQGGQGQDVIVGGTGLDVLTGGANSDIFVFDPLGMSFDFDNGIAEIRYEEREAYYKGTFTDRITDFNASEDRLSIIGMGHNTELFKAMALHANTLEEMIFRSSVDHDDQAQIVHVKTGALAGHSYLVYNALNASGVIEMTGMKGTLSLNNFIDASV